MVHAVIFDLDGVLVDSEPVWQRVRHEFVLERGGRWPDDAQHRLMGMSTPEWARYLADELAVGLPPEQIAELVVDRMAGEYASTLPLLPGATEVVEALATSWPLGLASSSPRRLIDGLLDAAGLGDAFLATVSTEEVAGGKPAPDVYLTVAHRLGVSPPHCVAVEDSTNGVRAALAADMAVVAIPRPQYPPAAEVLAQVSLVLKQITDLTPAVIAELR